MLPFGRNKNKKNGGGVFDKGQPDKLYSLLECLGEGTYGTVWTGQEKKTGKTCAVKIVTIDDDLEEIEQEIAIMKDSDSPYIVKFYGAYWADKKKIWMVMEHCIAGSLNDLMYVCDITLDVTQICTAAAAMSMGLKYLHKNLVIHRDIKAGNVLLTAEGHIRLADFGVSAKLKKAGDRTNTAIGAPFWMAPEVINEEPYDGKADIWSLGITCIELAEGRPPNSQINPMKALFIIPQQEPPTLQDKEKWPGEFHDFVKTCLVKNPKKRLSSSKILKHPFIEKECLAIENNEGKSQIMAKLVKKSLRKIEKWRVDEDGDEKEEESAGDIAQEPAQQAIESAHQPSEEEEDAQSEVSQQLYSPEHMKKMQQKESEMVRSSYNSGAPGSPLQSPKSPHPRPSMRSSVHLNPIRDGQIRQSVRHSSVRKVEPLRDVVAPQNGTLGRGNSFIRKSGQKDLSVADVANIMNSDLPANSNQVQAAVMTKEFIVLLKSIYKNDPNAFGGKPIKNWTVDDITVAVVGALHSVLGQQMPQQNTKARMNAFEANKLKNMKDDEEFDYAQFEEEELKNFMNPLEFDPKRDGPMPPPPPISEYDSDLDV